MKIEVRLFNSKGNSLLQVIVASGLMMVIALGVTSLIHSQNREVQAISEKLFTKELETQIRAQFEDQNFCNCALRNKSFDLTASPPSVIVADQFTKLVSGFSTGPTDAPPCTPNSTDLVPAVGLKLSGTNMTVGGIRLGPLTLVSPGVYKADLIVSFANSIRAIQHIKTNVQMNLNLSSGTPSSRPFSSCSGWGNSEVISKGSPVCMGSIVWDHHDSGSVSCLAPQTGYYRGIDNYRGGMAASPRYFANMGQLLSVQGYWTGGSHGCYERFSIGGSVVDNGWGDNGCHGSLSNYWIIYSYDQ